MGLGEWMVSFREHHQKECGWFRDLGAVSHDFGNICVELGFYIIYTPIQVALSPDPWSRRADPDELIQRSFPSSSCHWIPRSTIPLKHPCHFVGFSMNSTIITYHNHPAIGDPWKFKDLGHHGTYAQAARQPPTRRCMASPLRSFRKATERSSRLQATNVRSGNTPWSIIQNSWAIALLRFCLICFSWNMFGKWAHSNHLLAVGQVAMSLPGPCLSSAIGILTIFARPIVAMSDLSYFNSHCVCLNPRVNLFLICIVSLPFCLTHLLCDA